MTRYQIGFEHYCALISDLSNLYLSWARGLALLCGPHMAPDVETVLSWRLLVAIPCLVRGCEGYITPQPHCQWSHPPLQLLGCPPSHLCPQHNTPPQWSNNLKNSSVSFVLWMEGAMLSQYVEKLVHIVTLSLSLMLSSSLSQARISSSPSLSHISSLRNISLYPPCAYDEDCVSDHKCMQYMCYPWKTSTGFR